MSISEITKSALLRARHTVTLRPERGRRTYRNVASITEGTICHAVEGDHITTIDVPKSVGGSDGGPSPSIILRSALSSCIAIGIKQWAALADIDIRGVTVSVATRVDARGQLGVCSKTAPGFEEITMEIDIETDHSPEEVNEIVTKSLTFSPLIDALQNPQTINAKIRIGSED